MALPPDLKAVLDGVDAPTRLRLLRGMGEWIAGLLKGARLRKTRRQAADRVFAELVKARPDLDAVEADLGELSRGAEALRARRMLKKARRFESGPKPRKARKRPARRSRRRR